MPEKVRGAVIGTGKWGSIVATELHASPGWELAGVYDADPERARAIAERLGIPVFATAEACLADAAVQAVVISVPNDLHARMALSALEAGKHVYLEKPMALTVEAADTIVAAAAERGVVLTVSHIMRYFAPLMEIQRLVTTGTLGTVQAVSVSRRDHLARVGWLAQRQRVGGMLFQSACHEYDFLRWLLGDALDIYCLTGPRSIAHDSLNYPDLILSQIRFESGVVAQVWNCMTDPLMGYDGVVTGTGGTAWFDVYGGRVRWRRFDGAEQERTWQPPERWGPHAWMDGAGVAEGEAESLRALLDNFRAAIAGEAEPAVTGEDGAKVVEMAQAGYLSLSERRLVELPLPKADRARATYLEVPLHAAWTG